jgi:hypothetical protein
MNCCCARKASARDAAPSTVAPLRRGVPTKGGKPVGASPIRGPLGGVGIVFQAGQKEEGLLVASLAVDGPAEQSGQVCCPIFIACLVLPHLPSSCLPRLLGLVPPSLFTSLSPLHAFAILMMYHQNR